jgi:hypothetical protein
VSATSGRPLKGTKEARRAAAVVLETLGGLRSASDAAETLEVATARYYVLERRAIEGMIEALERRPRGRRRTLEAELEHARRELESVEHELARYQALYRASQRAFGLPREESRAQTARRKTKTTRTRRKKSRAEKVLDRLEKPAPVRRSSSDAGSGAGKEA